MIDNILTALGLSKGSAMGGFFGAAVSLRFIPGGGWQRCTTALAGWVCAANIAPLAIELAHINMTLRNEIGVAFLIGLLGMSVTSQIFAALPEWATALRRKVFGDKGD